MAGVRSRKDTYPMGPELGANDDGVVVVARCCAPEHRRRAGLPQKGESYAHHHTTAVIIAADLGVLGRTCCHGWLLGLLRMYPGQLRHGSVDFRHPGAYVRLAKLPVGRSGRGQLMVVALLPHTCGAE